MSIRVDDNYEQGVTALQARSAIDKVIAKLQSARRKFIASRLQEDGGMRDDSQHAVRILESRCRLLNRLYDANYGEASAATKARIELKLPNPDNGDIVDIGGRKHGVGRLDCKACDYDLVEIPHLPVPKQICMARLCEECLGGIQHAYLRPMGADIIRVYECERCGKKDYRRCG